jgi:hypothetical protein
MEARNQIIQAESSFYSQLLSAENDDVIKPSVGCNQVATRKHAEKGIARALAMGYIERRQKGARRYEYRLRWKGTN